MSGSKDGKLSSLAEFRREQRRLLQDKPEFQQPEDIYEKCCVPIKKIKGPKTGLLFDNRFARHCCLWDDNYPENPHRYKCIVDKFGEYKLTDRCRRWHIRNGNHTEVRTVHTNELIELFEATSHINDVAELERLSSLYDAVYFHQFTYKSAQLAVSSAIELAGGITSQTIRNGFAVVRPPGHHAMVNQFCGYCFYNNVAVAAKTVLEHWDVKRVLIVDWDVHHGQGTQQIFYEDPRVMYFSIHRYEHGAFWPNLRESNFDYIGNNKGKGYNINIPLNETGCTDADYLAIFHTILLPLAYEFNPDFILISAGYDAAIGCPEGKMFVTPGCYHHLTTSLMGLAGGKVCVMLEGGYFLPSLAEGAAQTLKALLQDPAPVLELKQRPKDSVIATIYNVIAALQDHWQCFSSIHKVHCNTFDGSRKHKIEIRYEGAEEQPPYPTRNCYPRNSSNDQQCYIEEIKRLQSQYHLNPVLFTNKVGYCYDTQMELHKSPRFNHYERPERLQRVVDILSELGILNRMIAIPSRQASSAEITTVHSTEYISKITNISSHVETEIMDKEGWTSVYTNEYTYASAILAAGSLINLVNVVISNQFNSGVAIIRPPGHHAEYSKAGGFCIFNNVAIAANYALEQGLKRILIVDFDIHHGNGIQKTFYDDPRVLYISIHRYENALFYPKSTDGNFTETGTGAGLGFNVNIAWNSMTMSDAEYIAAFTRVILPISYEYKPELVLVSAGFDACVGDPLGGYSVTPEAFGHFIHMLRPLAGGRIVIALEGGYNITSVAYSLSMCCRALLGDPLPPLSKCKKLNESAVISLKNTISVHRNHWQHLIDDVFVEGTDTILGSPLIS